MKERKGNEGRKRERIVEKKQFQRRERERLMEETTSVIEEIYDAYSCSPLIGFVTFSLLFLFLYIFPLASVFNLQV